MQGTLTNTEIEQNKYTRIPRSRIRMLSMFNTMEMRWAIVITVMPLHSVDMAFCITEAVWVSTLAVHSSKHSTWKSQYCQHSISLHIIRLLIQQKYKDTHSHMHKRHD